MRINCSLPGSNRYCFSVPLLPHGKVQNIVLVAVCVLLVYGLILLLRHPPVRWSTGRVEEAHHNPGHKFVVAVATDVKNTALQYGIVVDCGSSGSRVYVYFWPPHTGNQQDLLNIQPMLDPSIKPVVKKIEPGLSEYASRPSEASDYIHPLLEFAAKYVPASKHHETPLYILATAGLRMLSESEQEAILMDLRVDIPLHFNFLFTGTHAEVITGKQEGVYAWIAINYALGRFDHKPNDDSVVVVEVPGKDHTHIRKRTVAVADMGGASMQVAVEVMKSTPANKHHITEFNLGCSHSDWQHTYRVYVSTFLGYGANQVMNTYKDSRLASTYNSNNRTASSRWVTEPCLMPGHTELFGQNKAVIPTSPYQPTMFRGVGDFETCVSNLKLMLNVSGSCPGSSSCAPLAPPIDWDRTELYGFSEFYYTMEDIFRIAGKYNYNKFTTIAKDFCETDWKKVLSRHKQNLYARANNHRIKYQCFKSAWMIVVLHEGMGMPYESHKFFTTQLIDGREIHWTLGALLYKTRFFPLRELEGRNTHRNSHEQWRVLGAQWVLTGCVLVVVLAIFIYLRRLKIVRTDQLARVPSMSYFMVDSDELQPGTTLEILP